LRGRDWVSGEVCLHWIRILRDNLDLVKRVWGVGRPVTLDLDRPVYWAELPSQVMIVFESQEVQWRVLRQVEKIVDIVLEWVSPFVWVLVD
jgi:hypothetical protein